MTTNVYRPGHLSAGRARIMSGGIVVLLHILAGLAVLAHLRATRPDAPPARSLVLLTLKPDTPAPQPKPVTPTHSLAPPAVSLTSPILTISPRETRGITVPETVSPAPGGAAPGDRKTPNDLFSDQKKQEFKRFFKEQAIEDRRENAKAANTPNGCNVFRKQGEQDQPDEQTSNGIPRNFIPAFGVGVHTPDDGKGYMQPCN